MADQSSGGGWNFILPILFGYLAYHWFYYGTLPMNAEKWFVSAAPTAAVASRPPPPRQTIYVTSRELFQEYQANEVAADERFKGKDLVVSGRIESINKDFMNGIYLVLDTPNPYMRAQMPLSDADKSAAAGLKKDQRVQVLCKGMGMTLGSPMGRDCKFLLAQ